MQDNSNVYNIEGYLGPCAGTMGKVFLAVHKELSTSVAIRQYNLETAKDETAYLKEILVTKQLQHPNLLQYLDSFTRSNTLNIVTLFADYGSVSQIISRDFTHGIPEPACAAILRDVLLATSYLHSKGYIHRNIRGSHIFISSQGKALLGGLRDCLCILDKGNWHKTVYDFPQQLSKSLCWLSPELLEQNLRGYSQLSDVYSIGITACEMANGVTPYADLPSTQMLIEKLRGPAPQLWDASTLEHDNLSYSRTAPLSEHGAHEDKLVNTHVKDASRRAFSRSFHQFTLLCLQREPSLRPSSSQLLKHAFFQHLKKTTYHNWSELLSPARPIMADSSDVPVNLEQIYLADQFSWDFTMESDL